MTPYVVVFLAAAATTCVATPLVRRLSVRLGAIAQPSDRMVHEKPTPSMGGMAMFAGVLVALTVAAQLPFFDGLGRSRAQWLAVVTATSVIVFFGAVDDIKGLSAPS
jgi:UDP-GlcNAc:undecaprenyl-phosphate GlcNAc-1-phosphate transferase